MNPCGFLLLESRWTDWCRLVQYLCGGSASAHVVISSSITCQHVADLNLSRDSFHRLHSENRHPTNYHSAAGIKRSSMKSQSSVSSSEELLALLWEQSLWLLFYALGYNINMSESLKGLFISLFKRLHVTSAGLCINFINNKTKYKQN